MIVRIHTENEDYEYITLDFNSMKEANDYVQWYLENVDYGVVCVKEITDEMIELNCDVV